MVYVDLDAQGAQGPWSWVVQQACEPLRREVSGGLSGVQGIVFEESTPTLDVDVAAFQARACEMLREAGDLLPGLARTPGDATADWILTGRVTEGTASDLLLHLALLERTGTTWTSRWSSQRRFRPR